jgi:alkylhydroperoxidase family enzyme
MARVRSLEGREAGILAGIFQSVFRLALGRPLNPTKVQAHAPRAMLASFLSNLILGSGRWAIGRSLVLMIRLRVAARNGCPF